MLTKKQIKSIVEKTIRFYESGILLDEITYTDKSKWFISHNNSICECFYLLARAYIDEPFGVRTFMKLSGIDIEKYKPIKTFDENYWFKKGDNEPRIEILKAYLKEL